LPVQDFNFATRIRRLAAIEIALHGYRFIYFEYLAGVVLGLALGFIMLFRSHSVWSLALGVYLVCLGTNYVPMLIYTIAIGNRQNAQAEIAIELADQGKKKATSTYRNVSLLLLVPLVMPVIAATHELFRSRSANG